MLTFFRNILVKEKNLHFALSCLSKIHLKMQLFSLNEYSGNYYNLAPRLISQSLSEIV